MGDASHLKCNDESISASGFFGNYTAFWIKEFNLMKKKYVFLVSFLFICGNVFSQVIEYAASDVIPVKSMPSEDGGTVWEESFELKGGYELLFRPTLCISTREYKYQVQLRKGGKVKSMDKNYSASKKHFPRFNPALDFTNVFFIEYYDGSYYADGYMKSTGNGFMHCLIGAADAENDLLIYCEENDDSIYLMDFRNKKKRRLDNYLVFEGYHGSSWHYMCFTFDEVTDKEIYLTYSGSFDDEGNEVPQSFVLKR